MVWDPNLSEVTSPTALVPRARVRMHWQPRRWTVGVTWIPAESMLWWFPCPCVGFQFHLPPRRVVAGVRRGLRPFLIPLMIVLPALVCAIAGFWWGQRAAVTSLYFSAPVVVSANAPSPAPVAEVLLAPMPSTVSHAPASAHMATASSSSPSLSVTVPSAKEVAAPVPPALPKNPYDDPAARSRY